MLIKLWGARGSLPAPLYPQTVEDRIKEAIEGFLGEANTDASQIPEYLAKLPFHRLGGYGGNTPCIEVSAGEDRLIVDGGSGIRGLGYDLMAGPCGQGKGEIHLIFTHFHWDHLIGLPFFAPFFVPGNLIHVYAVQPELKQIFETVFRKPYFPVELENLGSTIEYHRLEPRKKMRFGEISVTPYRLDHPDPCWGFKFDHNGKVFSHCVDTECTRVTRVEMGEDLPLYQNVDLMTFDAQYTLLESMEKVNWGHASAGIGLDIAMREGIKRILFMHHDPASSDEKIASAEAQTRRYYEKQLKQCRDLGKPVHEVEWSFVREGMIFEL